MRNHLFSELLTESKVVDLIKSRIKYADLLSDSSNKKLWLIRSVQAGEIALLSHYSNQPLIMKDEIVKVQVSNEPIIVETSGYALNFGYLKEKIQIRLSDDTKVNAYVVDKGVVRIE